MATIGLIGSGNIGQAIAKQAISHGHQVVLSNSRGPETLAELVGELGPRARAATVAEAASAGDIVVVAVPFKNYPQVPVEPLVGKVVIDTNNYYFERDGHFADVDRGETTASGKLAEHLPGARVVKAFNSIRAAEIGDDAAPAGTPNRRALPIAGDDDAAKHVVRDLIDEFGFDVVDAGALAEGRRYDRDQPAYGARLTADELREALATAA
ncbi:MAG: 8-hydroxy-5-deazaflavin:NADPH oxidoreductase [Pseudonocardiales bacterium]|jgi:predicted dinucleotide-binding enzyme|nr:8-hydroxy-5-deazaflavin:NADPH oxidoreductase [Pseudonocardiales bacterium]